MRGVALWIALALTLSHSWGTAHPMVVTKKMRGTAAEDAAVIADLQRRLGVASALLSKSGVLSPGGGSGNCSAGQRLQHDCTCEDYCSGQCFSLLCAPCAPAAFSWPGGEALCLATGPLGTGLLCHVDPVSGAVTGDACCSTDGPTCWLPQGSCCASGSCDTCPKYPAQSSLFPPLKRYFNNVTSTCTDM